MNDKSWARIRSLSHLISLILVGAIVAEVAAVPTFISTDARLPNPDRPYEMTSGTVNYFSPAFFSYAIYDLNFQALNPAQLNIPTMNMDGNWEFDSTFDIAYRATVGIGLAPPEGRKGVGTARVHGIAPGGTEPKVFDTELLSLDLQGIAAPFVLFMFRESPTLRSTGVTTVEGACYGLDCPPNVNPIRISSFFDVFTEVTSDGGATWHPGDRSMHIEQTPEPGTGLLVGLAAMVVGVKARRGIAS